MNSFIALMRQDIALAWRQNSAGLSISFFMIAVALIPFGLGPDLKLLRDIAPGLVWVALLLAVLLSLESIFQADLEDGSFVKNDDLKTYFQNPLFYFCFPTNPWWAADACNYFWANA